MPPDPVETGSARDWLRHARNDLALARSGKTRTVLYEHLCFHAQQAAEKALKAVLVANRIAAAKTHDMAFLLDALPASVAVPPSLIELPLLNRYAVQHRYPGEAPRVTRKDLAEALRMAEDAISWASRRIRGASKAP